MAVSWSALTALTAPLALLAGLATAHASAPCELAGMQAEAAFGLPNGLLLAIGRVESGRWDPLAGRVVPWPWAVNLGGTGQLAASKEEAIRVASDAISRGQRNVDVGCFQVNLLHHPSAFVNLDAAFDPSTNARYAAGLLVDLKGRFGSWAAAIEYYHSADPARGIPYGRAVKGRWIEAASSGLASQPVMSHGMRIWTPSSPGAAPSIVKIETGGGVGRGKTLPLPQVR